MEITSFWVVLAMCLVPAAVGILAVVFDEYEAQHHGWHKTHV